MIIRTLVLAGTTWFAGAALAAGQSQSDGNDGASQGLAIGQHPKLLQVTRQTNAGAGNGGEFYRVCSFTGKAHNMCSLADRDPGNSQLHNQSPECDVIGCEFDPGR